MCLPMTICNCKLDLECGTENSGRNCEHRDAHNTGFKLHINIKYLFLILLIGVGMEYTYLDGHQTGFHCIYALLFVTYSATGKNCQNRFISFSLSLKTNKDI